MKEKIIKRTASASIDEDKLEALHDLARAHGYRGVSGLLGAMIETQIERMGNGGYLEYIRRRREWYKTQTSDYIESKEFCDKWLFDFNAFARSKIVTNPMRLKRY